MTLADFDTDDLRALAAYLRALNEPRFLQWADIVDFAANRCDRLDEVELSADDPEFGY